MVNKNQLFRQWLPKTEKDWTRLNNKLYFHSKRLGGAGRNLFTSASFYIPIWKSNEIN